MIEKFAAAELKNLIKLHTQQIYQCIANNDAATVFDPALKELLLNACCRLHELIEELPTPPKKGSKCGTETTWP